MKDFLISKRNYIIIGFLLLHLFLSTTSVYDNSLNWDERCDAGLGKYLLKTGNFQIDGAKYHPVFSYYLNSIFLFFMEFPDYIWSLDSCWDIGNNIVFNSGYDSQQIVFFIRLPFILLSLLLAFYVYKWAKELYGIKAGLFALFIYSLSPSILAISGRALTDFPVACFIFISLYYYWKFTKNKTTKNLVLTGIFTGLALISKITAIYLFPIYLILAFFNTGKEKLARRAMAFFIIFLIAFLVIFTAYGFRVQTIASTLQEHYKERAYQEIDKQFGSNSIIGDTILFVFEKVPLPASNYISAVGTMAHYSTSGFRGFLLGKLKEPEQKWWYYFIIVFIVKTPIPTLIFLFLSAIFFRKIKKENAIDELLLIIPIIFLFVAFMLNRVSYDLRHILPIYPLIFVFISKVINLKFKNQKLWNVSFIFLLLWYIASTISVYPHYTAYFNEFVLPENGYKVLSGSNIDAGQELIRLKYFMEKNGIYKINFSFHGGVNPRNYGIEYDSMPTTCFAPVNENYEPFAANCKKDFIEDCSKRTGILAISVTNLQNRFLKNTTCYDWLKNYEPIEKVGYSVFVYNITK